MKLSLGDIEHFGRVNIEKFQVQNGVTVFCGPISVVPTGRDFRRRTFSLVRINLQIAVGKMPQESIDFDQISNFPADGGCYFLELCCAAVYLQHSHQVDVWPMENVT